MVKCLIHGRELRNHTDGNHQNRDCDNPKISPYLCTGQRLPGSSAEQQVIQIKIHAKQNHCHGHDGLLQICVSRQSVIFNCKSSRTGRAKTHGKRVKQRHSRKQKNYDLRHGHAEINRIQNHRRRPDFWNQLAHAWPRTFRPHDIHSRIAGLYGQNSQDKDQYAHSANPMRKTSPEEIRMGKPLHIRQDTGTCRSKSGNRLKKRIHKGGNIPGNHKRRRSENTEYDPAQRYDHQPFSSVNFSALYFMTRHEKTGQSAHSHCN